MLGRRAVGLGVEAGCGGYLWEWGVVRSVVGRGRLRALGGWGTGRIAAGVAVTSSGPAAIGAVGTWLRWGSGAAAEVGGRGEGGVGFWMGGWVWVSERGVGDGVVALGRGSGEGGGGEEGED